VGDLVIELEDLAWHRTRGWTRVQVWKIDDLWICSSRSSEPFAPIPDGMGETTVMTDLAKLEL